MTHRVDDQQSVIDIALQRYGSVEGVFQLLADNDIRLDEELEANAELVIDDTYAALPTVKSYYQQRSKKIATEYVLSTAPETLEYVEVDYNESEYN